MPKSSLINSVEVTHQSNHQARNVNKVDSHRCVIKYFVQFEFVILAKSNEPKPEQEMVEPMKPICLEDRLGFRTALMTTETAG